MSSDVGTLCQACALCCDGTLFTRVPLTVDEQVPEAKLNVQRNEAGARHVPQRCAALEGCRCTAYEARPLACRRFECLLVAGLREGEVSLDDALKTVERAKASRDPEFLTFYFGRRP